jgi:major membrane immunogen (membrane-anchored lipoprotein)
MSVSGISSSDFSNYGTQSTESSIQKLQLEFQQLGQDLQSGNLSASQSDFATLQSLQPQSSSTSSSQSNNPIAQAFSQLSQDLQSGNLSAAQQDYAAIQQAMKSQEATGHHHHHGSSSSGANEISQLLDQLGTALQSGDLSSAQSAFTTLQQEFQQLTQNDGQTSSQSSSNSVSVSA